MEIPGNLAVGKWITSETCIFKKKKNDCLAGIENSKTIDQSVSIASTVIKIDQRVQEFSNRFQPNPGHTDN